jgi:hypothetical protein
MCRQTLMNVSGLAPHQNQPFISWRPPQDHDSSVFEFLQSGGDEVNSCIQRCALCPGASRFEVNSWSRRPPPLGLAGLW